MCIAASPVANLQVTDIVYCEAPDVLHPVSPGKVLGLWGQACRGAMDLAVWKLRDDAVDGGLTRQTPHPRIENRIAAQQGSQAPALCISQAP